MEKLFEVPLRPQLDGAWDMVVRGVDQTIRTGRLWTNTYFGCFDCAAYARNTSVSAVRACVRGSERFWLTHVGGDGKQTVVGESDGAPIAATLDRFGDGYLYVTCDGWPKAIWYEGEGVEKPVRLAIIICTYRREEMVRKNLSLLMETIQADPLLGGCVDVICVDNGRTLADVPDGVRLIPNPNYGGSGGYARGMMEAEKCTHFWLMDDDIAFEPTTLRRVVTFLKYRKRESVRLAAGMFSFEQPTVQHEATASFDGYTFHSNCSGLDFSYPSSLVKNRIPENSNHLYGGWWSMVVPNEGRLPMPFFIKLDDVEYGLRGTDYAIMNGFGVWHEAFRKKGNAWSEYYTTRNTLIIQSMYPELGHRAVKTMGVRLLKSLAYGELKCMEAALKGVEDFVAGPEAFRGVNPEERHREIMKAYGAPLAADMTRRKMMKAAARNLPRNMSSVGAFMRAVRMLSKAKQDTAWKTLNTRVFWEKYLERREM